MQKAIYDIFSLLIIFFYAIKLKNVFLFFQKILFKYKIKFLTHNYLNIFTLIYNYT